MKRQTWSSQLTYILTVAGATIGFGATWRFPYMVGEHGGGAYVLVFCIAMILIGVPMILVENVIGRRAHTNSVDAFGPKAQNIPITRAWKILGYMGMIGSFGIMAYYMVLGGWVISYIVNIAGSLFGMQGSLDLSTPITKEATSAFYYESIEHSPFMIGLYTFIFVAINWFILRKGVIDGIERSMKYLMPLLLICLIGMVVRNLTLDGALAGVKFYLIPDFSKITPSIFLYVLGQVFFALSLGFGVMITLSSHLNKKEQLFKTAAITGIINTIIAVMAGFMIFPSLFSVGLEPDSGPSLVFKSLPIAFSQMQFGSFFAIVFFVLLLTAALATSITIYQVIISVLQEKFHFSKNSAINATLIGIFLLGNIPCVLTYGPWEDIRIFGRNIFDAFDFISGNIFFVLTALGSSIFVGWVLNREAIKELDNGKQEPSMLARIWLGYVRYIIPFVILAVFISGFIIKV
ncbi:sodium-dependent transporter [Helicobacter mustelae]|uniref:Transporter n=1 Tax=Helicobacter mustelae (strain ATCC 43772 / CCUG 25715 / CIP 103759 / LMG 18044 / NCTC 12198 / R85-136P) TaxID=679897 RepID=D3UFW6_HELM1|nr:sodium-dependent transporter [Helicobacter mustelae]CBG39387.1 putative sodium-dependent transmembrane transport protein [Helicobacter mustelae 12198]SQH70900.1 sodium-dependent transmembrane transport protein [Helicobacter mustelae]STP12027.1 sodium-dependent transmembrane transport protein [Helicobacter mustelae]